MRNTFSNRIGFIAAAAGSAVGLGNIWKFPFEVGERGGAAFLLMYLVFCFVLCFPILVAEISIGRKSQRNPIGAFTVLGHKKWSLVGILSMVAAVLVLSFYNVVAGWSFGYFIEMLNGNFSAGNQFPEFIKNMVKVGGYAALFMAATAFIVAKGVSGGIERTNKILMPLLILIIVMLAGYALTLPGAREGLKFYLIPDFSRINLEVIYNALGHAFFSLSLGFGALITYGSYVNKQENIVTAAAVITLTDIGVAFLAGFMMFPLVFSQGLETNGGAGLVFMTLPGVFEQLGPVLGIVVGALFFLLLSFAALTSTVSLFEIPVAYMVDEFQVNRKKAVWIAGIAIFIIGIPSMIANGYSDFFSHFITYVGSEGSVDFMTFISDIASNTFLPLGGLLVSVFVAYVWKKENLLHEISNGNISFADTLIGRYIGFGIKYVCPLVLGVIFLLTVLERFLGIHLVG